MESLPSPIPIFPLAGMLLLPRSQLPLHIFEPRYREMVRDVLASHQMIGMIQPRAFGEENESELFRVGCVGKVLSHKETPDGRFYLILDGVCRFHIMQELPQSPKGYRRVIPVYDVYRRDLGEPAPASLNRPGLLHQLDEFAKARQFYIEPQALEAMGDEELINALAIGLPFELEDKQALVEAYDLKARGVLLTSLLALESHPEAPANEWQQ